ncbi:unnamed protein product [Penicillium olsonii]|nr:unnamed protein product [Penicillium olsonii]
MWGNIAVLAINIIFMIAALGVSASKYSDQGFGSIAIYRGSCETTQYSKIGLHLLVNVLSVTMTATSSYCCTILMAPSRSDVDKAHAKGTWLSIGVASWRNFRNMKRSSQILWGLLLLTSTVMQMLSSHCCTTRLVSNSTVPTSYYESENCFPEERLHWNVTDLRRDILNGSFEYLRKKDCLDAYSTSYISDRRSLVLVTKEMLTNDGILLAGYGYAGGIPEMDPSRNLSQDWSAITDNQAYLDRHLGFDWVCYAHSANGGGLSSCSSGYVESLESWNVTANQWARLTTVELKDTWSNITVDMLETRSGYIESLEQTLNSSNIDWTHNEIEDFISLIATNPPTEQAWAYLNHTSWLKSVQNGAEVWSACPQASTMFYTGHEVTVDHCLSQKTGEACGLFYQVPIAFTIIICSLIKVACMWILLRTDRFDLFLTIGDAISSFLQSSDLTTKGWCTLSSDTVSSDNDCPWSHKSNTIEKEEFVSEEPHPGVLHTSRKTALQSTSGRDLPPEPKIWRQGTSGRIWAMTWLALILYIVISVLFPGLAVKNALGDDYEYGNPLVAIWQIKGWGAIESTALLSSYVGSFVGSVLVSNTPQLAVSFLYNCLNDSLTRCLIAADYNMFAVCRRRLRVSFPRGEQHSTLYLTIPYEYAIPLLVGFTLIHWIVSEGLFYVQVLPYDMNANPVPSQIMVTCGVSTVPLVLGILLAVFIFLCVAVISFRKFQDSKMPLALGMSVVVSAACHPPSDDLDAAYKPVQWGVIEADPDAPFLHCTFTSQNVMEPEEGVQYA